LASFWHQVDEVLDAGAHNALEVGPGNGQVTAWLTRYGVETTTLDVDPAVGADVLGSVTSIPLADDTFDAVLCAEVLEHLPFEQAVPALTELGRVARKRVIMSVPDLRPFAGIAYPLYFGPYINHVRTQIPAGRVRPLIAALQGRARWRDALFIAAVRAEWAFGGPVAQWRRAPIPHVPQSAEFDGEHYWEIGVREVPEERFQACFEAAGLAVENEYRVPENPWHHFFVARPR
jgi:SAM-dependent methyltransferase